MAWYMWWMFWERRARVVLLVAHSQDGNVAALNTVPRNFLRKLGEPLEPLNLVVGRLVDALDAVLGGRLGEECLRLGRCLLVSRDLHSVPTTSGKSVHGGRQSSSLRARRCIC